MEVLNKNELMKVNGGISLSGALLNYGRQAFQAVYNVGVALGSAIRRIITGNYCPVN